MPGLLNAKPTSGSARAQPGGGAQPLSGSTLNAPPSGDSGEEGNVSAEEQKSYDEFVANGMSLMNDEKALDVLLQSIQGDGNPIEGLANTVASIVMRVEDSAQQNGVEISGYVLMHGGMELLEQAADLAEQAGVHEFSDTDLESALYLSMDIYRTARQGQGKLDQNKFVQDLEEVKAAEADGSLEKEIPGLTELSKRTPAQQGNAQRPDVQPPQRGLLRSSP